MSYNQPHQSSAGPDDSFGRRIKVLLLAAVAPLVLIVGLVYSVVSNTPSNGPVNASTMPEAVAQRIQKVGAVAVRDTSGPRVLRSGEEVFTKGPCAGCHMTGAAGAPKYGDKTAWAPRIATGYAALLQSALKGKNGMAAQGGGEYADIEVARALVYLTKAAGANFPEPEVPTAPVAAAAAVSAPK